MTAGLVSIVIAEQRICRHVFYCTMKLDGEPRSGSEAAGEGARNRDRNKTDARAKRVTQRVTDRCGAAATIQTPARNIHRARVLFLTKAEIAFGNRLQRNSLQRNPFRAPGSAGHLSFSDFSQTLPSLSR